MISFKAFPEHLALRPQHASADLLHLRSFQIARIAQLILPTRRATLEPFSRLIQPVSSPRMCHLNLLTYTFLPNLSFTMGACARVIAL